MRLLLHSCCGPCTTFPLHFFRAQGFLVDGLFFNPNIYPDEEGEKRWLTYQQWANQAGLRTRRIEMPYEQWVKAVSKPGQCRQCYYVRLERTAQIAKAEGYDGFSTTLLVSPYQDHQGILIAMERSFPGTQYTLRIPGSQARIPAFQADGKGKPHVHAEILWL